MGLGNGNPNSGNKGSNWRYEYSVLKALECIVINTDTGGGVPGCCPATNALLTEIRDNTADIEVSLGAGDITVELAGVESRLDTVIANQTNGTQVIMLPTGAATSANQATEIASLASIDAGIPAALGQTTMAASMPVVIASNQTAIPISGTVSIGGGGAQVITSIIAVAGGSVVAGATSVGFATDAAFVGTINGVARDFLNFYSFESAPGKTLPAIPYTITAGSITIDSIV